MLNQKIGTAKIRNVIEQLLDLKQITVGDHQRLQGIKNTNAYDLTFGDVELVKMLAQEHLYPRTRGYDREAIMRGDTSSIPVGDNYQFNAAHAVAAEHRPAVDDANVRDQREDR